MPSDVPLPDDLPSRRSPAGLLSELSSLVSELDSARSAARRKTSTTTVLSTSSATLTRHRSTTTVLSQETATARSTTRGASQPTGLSASVAISTITSTSTIAPYQSLYAQPTAAAVPLRLSTGAIVGIAVGIMAFVACIGAAVGFCWRRRATVRKPAPSFVMQEATPWNSGPVVEAATGQSAFSTTTPPPPPTWETFDGNGRNAPPERDRSGQGGSRTLEPPADGPDSRWSVSTGHMGTDELFAIPPLGRVAARVRRLSRWPAARAGG